MHPRASADGFMQLSVLAGPEFETPQVRSLLQASNFIQSRINHVAACVKCSFHIVAI